MVNKKKVDAAVEFFTETNGFYKRKNLERLSQTRAEIRDKNVKVKGEGRLEDRRFTIYHERYVYLGGEIKDGCLKLTSEVMGDEDFPDREKHYIFTQEQTEKLFSVISLEDLIESCREGRLMWLEDFLSENGIHPEEWGM